MVKNDISERLISKFSYIIIEYDNESDDKEKQNEKHYILIFDKNVNGYNLWGGHHQDGDKPQASACRALREAVSNSYLKSCWNIDNNDTITDKEWEDISNSLVFIPEKSSAIFKLPYGVTPSQNKIESQEKLAELYLFKLSITQDNYPNLYTKLKSLTNSNILSLKQESIPLCKIFSAADLATEAWFNQDNPFIRFLFKHDILPLPESKRVSAPYLLNLPTLEIALERFLQKLFVKYDLSTKLHETFDVKIYCPAIDEVRLCLQANRTLRATMEIRWSGSDKVLRFIFPFPYHGVFILHSDKSLNGQAGTWVWHPRLVGSNSRYAKKPNIYRWSEI